MIHITNTVQTEAVINGHQNLTATRSEIFFGSFILNL